MYDLPGPTAKTRLRVTHADRSSSMTDAQTVAAEREATRLLAEAGYDHEGRPHVDEPDSVAPDEWMTDPLMSDYVDLYGSLEAAAEQYRANRWALLHADETRAYSMTERGGMSRYIDVDWRVEANLSSASFAYAPEQRMTDRRSWERARAPYGACYDAHGEVVYGATRIAPLAGGHTVTHGPDTHSVTPDGVPVVTGGTYTPLDARRLEARKATREQHNDARKANGHKGGAPRKQSATPQEEAKRAAARARKAASRARQRAQTVQPQQTAPITVQDVRGILPRIDWQADS